MSGIKAYTSGPISRFHEDLDRAITELVNDVRAVTAANVRDVAFERMWQAIECSISIVDRRDARDRMEKAMLDALKLK